MVLANPTHMALKPHTCTPNAGLMPIRCWCMPTWQLAHALAHQTAPFHRYVELAMTVYDRMYGIYPAKNAVYTPYIHMYVWFWPTLHIWPSSHTPARPMQDAHTHTLAHTHTPARPMQDWCPSGAGACLHANTHKPLHTRPHPFTHGPQATHLHAQCRTDAHQVLVHVHMPTCTRPCTPDRTLSHISKGSGLGQPGQPYLWLPVTTCDYLTNPNCDYLANPSWPTLAGQPYLSGLGQPYLWHWPSSHTPARPMQGWCPSGAGAWPHAT